MVNFKGDSQMTHQYRAKYKANDSHRRGRWLVGYLINETYIIEQNKDGSISAEKPVYPDTIGLCSGQQDKSGTNIFQGDIIENEKGLRFEVRFGEYTMYCPVDNCMMQNVGFYTVADGYYEDMPLGPTDQYAKIIGNIHDNPELKVDEKFRCMSLF